MMSRLSLSLTGGLVMGTDLARSLCNLASIFGIIFSPIKPFLGKLIHEAHFEVTSDEQRKRVAPVAQEMVRN